MAQSPALTTVSDKILLGGNLVSGVDVPTKVLTCEMVSGEVDPTYQFSVLTVASLNW